MTATTLPSDLPSPVRSAASSRSAVTDGADDRRVTQRSVCRAEWIKFVSVRSNVRALVGAGLVLLVFGTLFASLAGGDEALPPNAATASDSLSMTFAGMNLSQLVLGVLGAVFVAGEYTTGVIRTMFTAVADRVSVLRAKAIVLGFGSWLVMTVASVVVFFAGQAVYAGDGATYALTDDGVLRAVLGGGVYGAGIALMGLALGFLLRSTAAAIGTLVATLMVAPGLIGLLPDAFGDPVGKYLPSNAGQAFLAVSPSETLLSPGAGFVVFAVWAVGLLAAAVVVLRRRDA
jgi:ABC-type transport system involved in multi-copper enzyme maturation permease subunit